MPRAVPALSSAPSLGVVPALPDPRLRRDGGPVLRVPAHGHVTIKRARLRARPRDVAVRRRRGRAAGHDVREIMDFYYPGTTGARASGQVKVLITADTTRDVVVGRGPACGVRDPATGKDVPRCPTNGATRWRLDGRPGPGASSTTRPTRWHRWTTLGGRRRVPRRGGARRCTLVLRRRRQPAATAAALAARRPSAGSADRDTVNSCRSTATSRASSRSRCPRPGSPRRVRAQAVAARTYAAFARRSTREPRTTRSATPPRARSTAAYAAEHARVQRRRRRHRGQ